MKILFLCLILLTVCRGADSFDIHHGINVSHFLSQSDRRGNARESYFTAEDLTFIKEQGFDHIRLPVDEVQLWNEQGEKEPEAFRLLHQTLRDSQRLGLKVIVDLHSVRSHHFNRKEGRTLFTEAASQARFAERWRDLSEELHEYPVDFLAYELLNEPVADTAEDWNRVANHALKTVRQSEPERWVVVGANRWQSVDLVEKLVLPESDRRILLSFHFYIPMVITHYKASWVGIGKYDGPVHYPGVAVRKEDAEAFRKRSSLQDFKVWDEGKTYNRELLNEKLTSAVAFSQKTGRPLYCGEFGCYVKAPRDVRLRWTADMISIFNAHGIPWTQWDYQGGFGIRNSKDGSTDRELINTLLQGTDGE